MMRCFVRVQRKLSEFIQNHEVLNYDLDAVNHRHHRAKRSIGSSLNFKFKAYGTIFNIVLNRDVSTFASDFIIDTPEGILQDYDTSHIYTGYLAGIPGSYVSGSVIDGLFQGKIVIGDKMYYVEKARRYIDNFNSSKERHKGGCGITQKYIEEISKDNAKMDDDLTEEYYPEDFTSESDFSSYENIYSNFHEPETLYRTKRAPDLRRTCSLYIQTDSLLFEHIKGKFDEVKKVRDEITALIAEHVKAVNHIYSNTNFLGFNGFKFIVQRITVNDSSACDTQQKRAANLYCARNIDVSNFLNLNSHANHSAFCLAYVFTYRDFTGGTLGLAWVATPGSSGGICEKYKSYNEKISDKPVTIKRSLNTGIVTFVNYNTPVPPKVSQLTLAHEIGHNFGSLHDFPSQCRPGGAMGNYIMYSSATSGERPNNSKFSPCSIRNISAVLTAIFIKRTKTNCFQKTNGSFCGNKIVEPGEECDCGYDDEECTEKCCYPRMLSKRDLLMNSSAKPCSRKPNTECSPSQGPCCNSKCKLESKTLCKRVADCTHQSYCKYPFCNYIFTEIYRPKPNKTDCNEGTRICWAGACTGSICQKYNLEECFLTSTQEADPEMMCELACQEKGKLDTCKSTFQISKKYHMKPLKLQPGSPCNDFQGYCDVFRKCRSVDAEGPLARLKNLLFNRKTLMTIAEWVTEYWWGVLLMGVAFIILMALFIKCCAVHTPSSNPKKAPALKISDTLRRPSQTLRRARNRHQTAPRSQEPPPPYPGPPSAPILNQPSTSAGPSHGYGEGRGLYNKNGKQVAEPQAVSSKQRSNTGAWTREDPYAPAHPAPVNTVCNSSTFNVAKVHKFNRFVNPKHRSNVRRSSNHAMVNTKTVMEFDARQKLNEKAIRIKIFQCECVTSLKEQFSDTSCPITDDNPVFHKFCSKLERVLETGRKTRGLFGSEKCYWNYFSQCLISNKVNHDGLKFVKINTDQLKTSYGRGRAFIRYCLMHQSLADTLQQCFMNEKVTREWYSSYSVPCQTEVYSSFIMILYDLNDILFDLSPDLLNLDTGWPVFARKIFTSAVSWKSPSRSSSITSLNSSVSQILDATSSSITEINDEEKHQMQDEIQKMNTCVSEMKLERDRLLSEINDLQSNIEVQDVLKEKIKELEIINETLKEETKAMTAAWKEEEKNQINKLIESEKQAAEHFAKYSCCKNQLQVVNIEKNNLNESLTKLTKNNNNQEITLKLCEKELTDIKNAKYDEQIAELNAHITEYIRKNEIFNQEIKDLKSQTEVLIKKCDKKEKEIQELNDCQNLLKKQCSQLEQDKQLSADENLKLQIVCNEINLLVENLEKNKADLIKQFVASEKRAKQSENDLKNKEEELLNFQHVNKEYIEKNETLCLQNKELLCQTETLSKQYNEKIDELQELSNSQSLLETQCSKLKHEKELSAAENLKLVGLCDEVKLLVENLEKSKSDLIKQLTALENETTESQEELTEKKVEIIDLQHTNSEQQNNLDMTVKNMSEEIDQLKDQECSDCDLHKTQALSSSDQIELWKKQKNRAELERNEINQKYELLNREKNEHLMELADKDKSLTRCKTEIVELKKNFNSVDIILRKQEIMIDDLGKKLRISLEDNVKLNEQVKNRQDEIDHGDSNATCDVCEEPALFQSLDTIESEEQESPPLVDSLETLEVKEEDEEVLETANIDEELEVVSTASRTLTRLQSLVEEGEEIHNIVETAKEVSSTMRSKSVFQYCLVPSFLCIGKFWMEITLSTSLLLGEQLVLNHCFTFHSILRLSLILLKVQLQEEKLKHQKEVIELSESKFENLKTKHTKLLTSEAILKYELKEKRKMLEKLKKQLASSRKKSLAGRRLAEQSQEEWNILRKEFSERPKYHSEESELSPDEAKAQDNNADSAIASQSSSTSDTPITPCSELPDSSLTLPETNDPPTSSNENKKEYGIDRLKYLEQQCQFLYARLIQSSKKSDFLESKLNQMLGITSDGSDTDNNVESITELNDCVVSDPVAGNSSSQIEKEIPQVSADSTELTAYKCKESSQSSCEIQGDISETSNSNENTSPVPVLEMPQLQESSPSLNGLINSPENICEIDQNQFSASDEEIMNESEEESFGTKQLNDSNINNETPHTIGETSAEINESSVEINESSELFNEFPYVDDEQSELESQQTINEVLSTSSCDDLKTVNSNTDLSDVKDISEIRVGLKKMVANAKASAVIRDTNTQDLLSQISNLKNLLKKMESEKLELLRKESDMKKRAEFYIQSERKKLSEKMQTLSAENSEMKEKISKLTEKVEDFDLAKTDMIEVITLNEESKSLMEKELAAVKFQLGAEAIKCERALKGYTEQELNIVDMKQRIVEQEQLIIFLEETLKDIKDGREIEKSKQLQEKFLQFVKLERLNLALTTRDEECSTLTDELKQATKDLDDEYNLNSRLKAMLEETKMQNYEFVSKLEGDLFQLKKDNRDLMDKLIKLIRDKDALWQKTDRLTDFQKMSVGCRWMKNDETKQCLSCQADFTFILRKHHCRLCGQIFCFNCCNNWIMTTASSSKSRACNSCLINQTAMVTEVTDKSVLNSAAEDTQSCSKLLINEECESFVETKHRARSLSVSASHLLRSTEFEDDTNLLLVDNQAIDTSHYRIPLQFARSLSAPPCLGYSSTEENASQTSNSPIVEEFHVISDEEISKSLSGSNPYTLINDNNSNNRFQVATTKTVFDIESAQENFTEVWINAGGRYSIPFLIEDENILLKWEFMTKPSCIAFGVNYKEIDVIPNDVFTQPLLPIVRCKNSHTNAVFGHVKIRRRGIYILVFDNCFSTILAKKVKYKLTIQRDD
ncbi:Disintegrin and metalloproteinase domain-containing protein 10 [Nymphon striatum]|nr:Disintegrin and metalloproteinase domain-containing protein 10 [Nymphon striatum]